MQLKDLRAGFTTKNTQQKNLAEKLGWQESHLPSFWTEYFFEKKIGKKA